MSRSRSTTGPTTRWTRTRTHSRWRRFSLSRTACARPTRCCSSRSWRSKSRRRRKKWATSWATCRRAYVRFHAELAIHAIDDDLQVQLAHPGDDGLAGFLVGAHAERRVLLREAVERHAHLLLIGLGLGLDCHVDHRFREHHLLEDDDLVRIAQGFTGGDVLQAYRSG